MHQAMNAQPNPDTKTRAVRAGTYIVSNFCTRTWSVRHSSMTSREEVSFLSKPKPRKQAMQTHAATTSERRGACSNARLPQPPSSIASHRHRAPSRVMLPPASHCCGGGGEQCRAVPTCNWTLVTWMIAMKRKFTAKVLTRRRLVLQPCVG